MTDRSRSQVSFHWGVNQGKSCLANTHTDNCSLCADVPAAATAWRLNTTTGWLVPGNATAGAEGPCLTALPHAPDTLGQRLGLASCDTVAGNPNQTWVVTAAHELALKGGALCLTGVNVNCTAPTPSPPPGPPHPPGPPAQPPPPSPPHPWPEWKPRRLSNVIVTRMDWSRYLATLKEYPGAINTVSEYICEYVHVVLHGCAKPRSACSAHASVASTLTHTHTTIHNAQTKLATRSQRTGACRTERRTLSTLAVRCRH